MNRVVWIVALGVALGCTPDGDGGSQTDGGSSPRGR